MAAAKKAAAPKSATKPKSAPPPAATTAEIEIGTAALAADFRPIEGLIPYARNARTHSDEQVAQIAASIIEFGFTNPVLADAQGIIAGHGRVMGARQVYASGQSIKLPNGVEIPAGTVPVIDCTGWPKAKRQAYILADNQLAANAGWDYDLLKIEYGELIEEGFDMDLLGFSEAETDIILNGWEPDQGKVEAAGNNLDGIKATVRTLVEQEDAARAKAVISSALTEAGIKFAVL